MDWFNFFTGVGFLIGAFLIFKMRSWPPYKDWADWAKFADRIGRAKVWVAFTIFVIIGIVFICKSFLTDIL